MARSAVCSGCLDRWQVLQHVLRHDCVAFVVGVKIVWQQVGIVGIEYVETVYVGDVFVAVSTERFYGAFLRSVSTEHFY